VGGAFRAAIATIRALGGIVIDDVDFEHWQPSAGMREDLFGDLLLREGSYFGVRAMEKLLTSTKHTKDSLGDLLKTQKGSKISPTLSNSSRRVSRMSNMGSSVRVGLKVQEMLPVLQLPRTFLRSKHAWSI